jgi:hypothetical protein
MLARETNVSTWRRLGNSATPHEEEKNEYESRGFQRRAAVFGSIARQHRQASRGSAEAGGQPTVYDHRMARNIGCRVRTHPNDGFGRFFGIANSASRSHRFETFHYLLTGLGIVAGGRGQMTCSASASRMRPLLVH